MRRLFWLTFIVASGASLVLLTIDLLPGARSARAGWRDLVARAVPSTAVVVSKRKEYRGSGGESFYLFYVTLEREKGGSGSRAELAFHAAADSWERLRVGEVVPIRMDPDRPDRFYAPSFLEISESFAPEEAEYWMYLAMGGAVLVGLGLLFYGTISGRPAGPGALTDKGAPNGPRRDG